MNTKHRMRVYAPDFDTDFMKHLPAVQRPAAQGEPVEQVVVVCHPATKIKKERVK